MKDFKKFYISSVTQAIQPEECAYLYKCKWWASVFCQTLSANQKPDYPFSLFPSPLKCLICIRAVGCGGNKILVLTLRIVSCDLTSRCTEHKGYVVVEK